MPIVGIRGAAGAGRSSAASALHLLGYEPASFGDRLRHMISNSTGLPETEMTERPDEPFAKPIKLQAFHIDGMCRIAAAWVNLPNEAPKVMREKAAKVALDTPRQMMSFVRHDLFEVCVSPTFWVDCFRSHYKPERDNNLVIDDVESDAEVEMIEQLQGLLLGVTRPGLDDAVEGCDLVVPNDGTLEQLQDRVVALLFGHFRGAPLALADSLPLPAPTADAARSQELERLQRRVDELTGQLQQEQDSHATEVARLEAEQQTLSAAVAAAEQAASAVLQAVPGTPAVGSPDDDEPAAADRTAELETAALAARLALALGLEAGLGRDSEGQSILCIDLPSGRVGWPVEQSELPGLPRFDKAAGLLDAEAHRAALLDPQVQRAVSTEQALNRENSELAHIGGVLHDLVLLAEGCKIHRAYRAKQAPKSDCPTCWAMHHATERLQQLGNLYRPGG